MGSVYSIAAGVPFADALARGVMERYGAQPDSLPRVTIFLPTNRACRELQDAFLRLYPQRAMLLPALRTLGHVDEEDLSLNIAGLGGVEDMLAIPPAISPLKRQIMLATLIKEIPGRADTVAQAMQLAGSLAHLMDQIHTEGLSLGDLRRIVPEEFAAHWKITLVFFSILEEKWPQILADEGEIDPAARRDMLIRALSAHWLAHPPKDPVIVAGSTGSIPATAEFLSCVADLPQGSVIFPGLDVAMDDAQWEMIAADHPQAGLKGVLEFLDVPRGDVQPWLGGGVSDLALARHDLAREIMRPDDSVGEWVTLRDDPDAVKRLQAAMDNVAVFEVDHEYDEATLIAVHLREVLEAPDKTALLITPDRHLARRVSAMCQRWGIEIDDSAGQPLSRTPVGIFMHLILDAWRHDFDAVRLLALLKHGLCDLGLDPDVYHAAVQEFELIVLRSDDVVSVPEFIFNFKSDEKWREKLSDKVVLLLDALEPILRVGLEGGVREKLFDINCLVDLHVHIFDALTGHAFVQGARNGPRVADVQAHDMVIKQLFILSKQPVLFNKINLDDYAQVFTIALSGGVMRPAYGGHPRLKILGQIEARTLFADVVIMAGLNEGMWPSSSLVDPWMSQAMRSDFGLPEADQYISLAAHDFVQGLCQPRAVLTRSRKVGGAPTVPSRWLQRLSAIQEATGISFSTDKTRLYLHLARLLNVRQHDVQIDRPAPCPPVAVRPKRLSVTQVEMLLQDPYSIYARHILKLKQLNDLDDDRIAAAKGTIVHDVLEKMGETFPHILPDDAVNQMMDWARYVYKNCVKDPYLWSYWAPQFHRVFSDTVSHEKEWRKSHKLLKVEAKGVLSMPLGDGYFELTARADRIDTVLCDADEPGQAQAAIIDYKTGGYGFAVKQLKAGSYPQLPLQAMILAAGGFDDLPSMECAYMGYWYKSHNSNAGKVIAISGDDAQDARDHAAGQLRSLIVAYADAAMPYMSLPDPANQPRYNDYLHLSRVAEWSDHLDNDSEEGA